MQNMEQTNSEILELTDAELGAISGGITIGPITVASVGDGILFGIKGVGYMSIHNDGTVCTTGGGGYCTGGPNPPG